MFYVGMDMSFMIKISRKKTKRKNISDSLREAQMVQTKIQHNLGKKNPKKFKPEFLFKYQPLVQKPKGNSAANSGLKLLLPCTPTPVKNQLNCNSKFFTSDKMRKPNIENL